MSKLNVDPKPFQETHHYSGEYKCDCSQWEDEYQEETFEFTVVVNYDNDNQMASIAEIVWTDQIPPRVEEVEDKINANFFTLIEQDNEQRS